MRLFERSKPGIFLAADFLSLDNCLRLIETLEDLLAGIKIGHVLLSDPDHGYRSIELLRKYLDIPILVDGKIHDVEHIATLFCRRLLDLGADGVTVWGHCGPSVLSACASLDKNFAIVVLTELTEPSARPFHDALADFVATAIQSGAHAIQAPGTNLNTIKEARSLVGPKFPIFSCGIGTQGGDAIDAIEAGADYLIVGRTIVQSPTPMETAEELCNRIKLITRQ